MSSAFVTGAALPTRTGYRSSSTCPRMASAQEVVEIYYPPHVRNRAPTIVFDGEAGISCSMKPIASFCDVDLSTGPLLDYSNDDEFVPNKPVAPSPISWPSGDGRGVKMGGTKGYFSQPNLKEYGPFPDFFKRSCDG